MNGFVDGEKLIIGIPPSHICVCICTYKRLHLLNKLIANLQAQETDGLFSYSIVIVDNDHARSAQRTVSDWREKTRVPIDYVVEPEKSISAARNRAIRQAKGDYVACIDDDEFPCDTWLLRLYQTCCEYQVDGVMGPVIPYFLSIPPTWVMKGGVCNRASYPTGTTMHWSKSAFGNILLSRKILNYSPQPFNPKFRFQGEDVAFFKDMNQRGHSFVWCTDATVYELMTDDRCRKAYFLRRAFVQGHVSLQYIDSHTVHQKIYIVLKSATAIALYTSLLPFCLMRGFHVFMKYLIKDVHHASRLLALFQVVSLKERGF